MSLNLKQIRFCEEYIVNLNATEAAINAGYSKKTAYSIGQRLLKNVEIQNYISELKKKRSERTQVTADMVVQELAKIGFANITDFLKVDDVIITTKGNRGRPSKRKQRVVVINKTGEIHPDKIAAISEIRQTDAGISLKMHDKEKALELLGRHLGIFTDNLKLKGDKDEPVQVQTQQGPDLSGLSYEQLYELKYGKKPGDS